tara:strand:- start:11480 stop:12340 length:861 start_codon:yes stop_codon:yes gene_type:complete
MKTKQDFNLTEFNSYKISATCKRAFFPETSADFITIYKEYFDSPKIILGGGYNVILSKPSYEEDFILIGESFANTEFSTNGIVEIESGADLRKISELAYSEGLSGLEVFCDIPSSLGGAVVMNAGASGVEIKDVLIKAQYLDLEDFLIKEISVDEIGFEYRNSFFQRNTDKIILKAWLQLKDGKPKAIREKMDLIKKARWQKQPREFPNAGSVFKRPEGHYVGTMVESLGLKGYSIGGAKISEKHAGFIVNFKNASGKDILDLIHHVQAKVKEKYKVDLEVEQRVI